MDVAKVARDYFLSSQSSLLIPNRNYGARKMIHVGIGRSNSSSDFTRVANNNNNSNLNRRHHSTDDDFPVRGGAFHTEQQLEQMSTPGIPEHAEEEENGANGENHWRNLTGGETYSNGNGEGIPEDDRPTGFSPRSYGGAGFPNNNSGFPDDIFQPSSNGFGSDISRPRPASLPLASKTPSSPSSPSSLSPSSATSSKSRPGAFGNLKGLFGAGLRNKEALRQRALAMKSDSVDSEQPNMDVDRMDFRATSSKAWQHPPDALLSGHVLYNVKFLGECVVEQTKGAEVIKDAIRKMKFSKHIKRAEGQKPPKVDLVISADAVSILDKSKNMLHRYPLHLISYCADDKADKRMVTFIAKEASGTKHFCYVFDSDKCAEEITLTIGQAFDLAYKKYLESNASSGDVRKQYINLQKRVQALTFENQALRRRVADLEKLKDRSDVEQYRHANQISDLSTVNLNLRESSSDHDVTPGGHQPTVGRRLENLLPMEGSPAPSNGSSPGRHTNGGHAQTPESASMPILSPPPANTRSLRSNSLRTPGPPTPGTPTGNNPFQASPTPVDPFGPITGPVDPFGMEAFTPATVTGNSEQELMDIRDGFKRGLSFGTDDFSLDDLDPLNQRM